MGRKLDDPKVRARFLKAFAATGNYTAAAARTGLTRSIVKHYRSIDPAFMAACEAVVAATVPVRAALVAFTPARRQRLIAALAEAGSVVAACASAGIAVDAAYQLRRRDAQFAADWCDAREQALDRVEDKLFEAALNGFEQVTTGKDGAVTTRRTQQAAAMFKLLERRRRTGRSHRTIELTPALLAEARIKFEAALRRAAETGEVPPPAIATLPAPTVTAR